jgi:hypothetical protein
MLAILGKNGWFKDKISGVVRFWAQILVSVNFAPNFWFGLICGLRVWQFGAKILFFDFISW